MVICALSLPGIGDPDGIMFWGLNSAVVTLGAIVVVRCQKLQSGVGRIEREHDPRNLDGFADVRWQQLARLVSELNFTFQELQDLTAYSGIRDELNRLRVWNEMLPVSGFLGTVFPLAWFFSSAPGGSALGTAILQPLATALWTTVLGMSFFIGLSVWISSLEKRLSAVEHGFGKQLARLARNGGRQPPTKSSAPTTNDAAPSSAIQEAGK